MMVFFHGKKYKGNAIRDLKYLFLKEVCMFRSVKNSMKN